MVWKSNVEEVELTVGLAGAVLCCAVLWMRDGCPRTFAESPGDAEMRACVTLQPAVAQQQSHTDGYAGAGFCAPISDYCV